MGCNCMTKVSSAIWPLATLRWNWCNSWTSAQARDASRVVGADVADICAWQYRMQADRIALVQMQVKGFTEGGRIDPQDSGTAG